MVSTQVYVLAAVSTP